MHSKTLAELRKAAYNAALVEVVRVHEALAILRVRPDWQIPTFAAGQYTTLGLGNWESTVADGGGTIPSLADDQRMVKRAYSVSCSLLDAAGNLLRVSEAHYLEFYVSLVHHAEAHGPALTPRLFALTPGDRLFVGPRFVGHYTLAKVQPDDDVLFIATGTGEAPHNAMLADLLALGHRGRIASIVCVRLRLDLGYLTQHRELERRYGNYRYVALTTREPENLDQTAPGYAGKVYLQKYFERGDCERVLGYSLDPDHTHAFLCGNPAMIGLPRTELGGGYTETQSSGMVRVLESRGLRLDTPRSVGNIHCERFW
jgi:ferredoxin--NADP+ reductase